MLPVLIPCSAMAALRNKSKGLAVWLAALPAWLLGLAPAAAAAMLAPAAPCQPAACRDVIGLHRGRDRVRLLYVSWRCRCGLVLACYCTHGRASHRCVDREDQQPADPCCFLLLCFRSARAPFSG
jgi:hypothetical protein